MPISIKPKRVDAIWCGCERRRSNQQLYIWNKNDMSAKKAPFIVVCLHDDWEFNEKSFPIIKSVVEQSEPAYSEFLKPNVFTAFFKDDEKGKRNASQLIEYLAALRNKNSSFRKLGVGSSQGELIAEFSLLGRVKSTPVGMVINEAMSVAQENSIAASNRSHGHG